MSDQSVPSVGDRVIISGGKKVGSVSSLETDDDGRTSGFVVHFGWRGRRAKFVPLNAVKWCNPGSVILDLSRHHFDDLADWVAPATSDGQKGLPDASHQAAHP